jgi:SOS-response transcriptional repressor LexA
MRGLTDAQYAMVGWFVDFAVPNGRWPTIRETMGRFGFASTNGPRAAYKGLQRKGYMKVVGGRWTLTGYHFELVADHVPIST